MKTRIFSLAFLAVACVLILECAGGAPGPSAPVPDQTFVGSLPVNWNDGSPVSNVVFRAESPDWNRSIPVVDGILKITADAQLMAAKEYTFSFYDYTGSKIEVIFQGKKVRSFKAKASDLENLSFVFLSQPISPPKATLTLAGDIGGATILIDNKVVKVLNSWEKSFSKEVWYGDYQVIVRKFGFQDWVAFFSVRVNGAVIKFEPVLIPKASERGNLVITSNPSGADVYIDKEKKGVTPLTLANLEAKDYELKIDSNNKYYDVYEATVRVIVGQTRNVHVNLVPLPQGFDPDDVPWEGIWFEGNWHHQIRVSVKDEVTWITGFSQPFKKIGKQLVSVDEHVHDPFAWQERGIWYFSYQFLRDDGFNAKTTYKKES